MTAPPTLRALCSGYGGLDLAVEEVTGARLVDHAEIDANAAEVHDTHWPGIPNLGDITAVDWAALEPTEILCAGYPCQPFSTAGRRRGANDERHLWPHIFEAVRLLRPRLVVLENVAGHLSLGFGTVLGDLASIRYDARWRCLRASDVGACHRRDRVFVVAESRAVGVAPNADGPGLQGPGAVRGGRRELTARSGGVELLADPDGDRFPFRAQPACRPVAPGIEPPRRDDAHRLGDVAWGKYEPAIRRHEHTFGRPAPDPTDDAGRLSPRFVEWMMTLPDGWVTSVDISRTAQLEILGRGVVPPQAVAALTSLLRAHTGDLVA